nr:SEC-C metal-binding domain-containing protein [Sphingomonas sp. CFBP 8764]
MWEYWIDGLTDAVALRPEAWDALADDPARAAPWSQLATLIAVAGNESDLDSVEINALQDRAPAELTDAVQRLYAAQVSVAGPSSPDVSATTASKVGRNDLCPCGSGKKHKRCCG